MLTNKGDSKIKRSQINRMTKTKKRDVTGPMDITPKEPKTIIRRY